MTIQPLSLQRRMLLVAYLGLVAAVTTCPLLALPVTWLPQATTDDAAIRTAANSALDKLRTILASLGLANNATLQTQSGRPAYGHKLFYGDDDSEPKRFVSLNRYVEELGTGDPVALERLVRAMIDYYAHIIYSNGLFAVDTVVNNRKTPSVQTLGAAHLFLDEARDVEDMCRAAEARFNIVHLGTPAMHDYLDQALVYPSDPFFKRVNNNPYTPALSRAGVVNATRRDFVLASSKLVFKRDGVSTKTLRRQLRLGAASGFGSAADLMAYVDGI